MFRKNSHNGSSVMLLVILAVFLISWFPHGAMSQEPCQVSGTICEGHNGTHNACYWGARCRSNPASVNDSSVQWIGQNMYPSESSDDFFALIVDSKGPSREMTLRFAGSESQCHHFFQTVLQCLAQTYRIHIYHVRVAYYRRV